MASKFARHLRLFPAVILVSGGLLVLKGAGLVHDARAQDAMSGQVPATPPQTTTQVAVATDPTADDSESTSAAQVDVLTSLSKRRAELDARGQALDMQANLIMAAENRVDGKIASLKQLQSQIQQLLVQRDAADQKQLDVLVRTYSSMKPKDAARIFNNLNDDVLLSVAGQMKPDVLGAVMAQMLPDNAQKLTVRLANRLKLPDPPPLAPSMAAMPASAQQMTSVDPAAATAQTPAATNVAPLPPASAPPAAVANTPAPSAASATAKPQAVTTASVPAVAKPQPASTPPVNANPQTPNAATAPKPATPAPAVKGKTG